MDSLCGRRAQVPTLFQSSLLADVIVEVKDGSEECWPGLSYRCTSVTGRAAFRRASMNEVNPLPVLPLPSFCSLGNSYKGSSPPSNCRE